MISYCLQLRGRSVRFLAALLHKQDTASQPAGRPAPPNFVSLASACVLLNATLSDLSHLLFRVLRSYCSQVNSAIFFTICKHLLVLKIPHTKTNINEGHYVDLSQNCIDFKSVHFITICKASETKSTKKCNSAHYRRCENNEKQLHLFGKKHKCNFREWK